MCDIVLSYFDCLIVVTCNQCKEFTMKWINYDFVELPNSFKKKN